MNHSIRALILLASLGLIGLPGLAAAQTASPTLAPVGVQPTAPAGQPAALPPPTAQPLVPAQSATGSTVAVQPATAAVQPAQPAAPPGYMWVPASAAQPAASDAESLELELPYHEGEPPPPGYHLAERPRRGLLIGGSLTLGIPWLISSTTAVGYDFERKTSALMVPGIGPWLMLAAGGGETGAARAWIYLDGMVQTAGAIMLGFGLASNSKIYVRDPVTVAFVPTTVGRDGYGLSAAGTF